MPKLKLTKSQVDGLPFATKNQTIYWDTALPGFGVCVGAKSKSYIVQRDINGRTVRYTIGSSSFYSFHIAQLEAKELLVQMAKGTNPNERKKEAQKRGITLKSLHENYLSDGVYRLSDDTVVNYKDFMDNHLSDWKDFPIREIDKEMVANRHRRITETSGKVAANATMQYLRALYNYAADDDEDLLNPVRVLSSRRLWHPKLRRNSFIRDHQLPAWNKAVMNLQDQGMKDALRLILFTGARKMEALTIKWENVDLAGKSFTFPHTKNKTPLELPMSDFLYEMFETRKKNAGDSPYVFTGKGQAGHLVEPKKAVKAVIEESGVQFMLHDLRRTFITKAESLDLSHYVLKSLVNHTIGKSDNDVTWGYIMKNPERLREPMQKVTDELLRCIQREQED